LLFFFVLLFDYLFTGFVDLLLDRGLDLIVNPNIGGCHYEVAWQDNTVVEFLKGQLLEDAVLAL
jgi:hypothetical protein